jgi:hypothetical protein
VEGDVREQGMCSEIDLPVLLRSYAHCVDFLGRCLTDWALSCAPPVYPDGTPAGGRRSCHPTGRPPAGSPGRPRGGGASAAAPC